MKSFCDLMASVAAIDTASKKKASKATLLGMFERHVLGEMSSPLW